jgi:hypothetical protein
MPECVISLHHFLPMKEFVLTGRNQQPTFISLFQVSFPIVPVPSPLLPRTQSLGLNFSTERLFRSTRPSSELLLSQNESKKVLVTCLDLQDLDRPTFGEPCAKPFIE